MNYSWVWKTKTKNNNPLEKIYEWYSIKPMGQFRRAYAIRPQYRIDYLTKAETNDIECYVVIEYAKCENDAILQYENETWFGAERYGKALFLHPQLLRVCFSFKMAQNCGM